MNRLQLPLTPASSNNSSPKNPTPKGRFPSTSSASLAGRVTSDLKQIFEQQKKLQSTTEIIERQLCEFNEKQKIVDSHTREKIPLN